MKRVIPLLASAHLAFGQTTVVTTLDEEFALDLPPIGIVPIADYQRATAEIGRLQRELDAALQKKALAKDVGAVVAEQKKVVQALRTQLKQAQKEEAGLLQDGQAQFAQREKAMVAKVNALEKARGVATAKFQQRIASLQSEIGRKEGDWKRKLMFAEEERDNARQALAQLEDERVREREDRKEWERSVISWRRETEHVVRAAQLKQAQDAVANTARLAADWHAERKVLQTRVAELSRQQVEDKKAWEQAVAQWQEQTRRAVRTANAQEAQKAVANTARLATEWQTEREDLTQRLKELKSLRAEENEAWKKAVADWEEKAKKAMRTASVKEAQSSVANTARLAQEWQAERTDLEEQVKEMSAKLAKLEGQLGVQGFEDQQAEVLRLGLAQKSQALTELGADASRLALEWQQERAHSRRDLDAMRGLYKSTMKDVETSDQRVRQLDAALAEKDAALEVLAQEATKLSGSWKEQRGGLQKKIATLEKKLASCQQKLGESAQQRKSASNTKLAEQLAVVADLQSNLALAKKREGSLKSGLMTLREEVAKCKKEVLNFKSQKESDAKALASLRAELKEVKDNYAAAERDLASTSKALAGSRAQRKNLQIKFDQLAAELTKAQEELKAARQEAAANQKAKAEAAEKAAQVKNLENQLGRLAVAQQELEGTLISTLGDFEQLQGAYTSLQAEAAGGGEVAQKAIAARKAAESELKTLQERLQGEEAKIGKARERVQEAEEKRKAAEAEAEAATKAAKAAATAGKAALGKFEAELQTARREMSEMQLGKELLEKEAEALRKRFVQIEPVRYQLASANVVAQQQRVLAEVKQVLEVYPEAGFSIQGHTCNIGSEEANLELSEDRAQVLRDFLVQNGIPPTRFTLVEGCGDTQPQASNETDEGRQKNRRVEIEVVR